MPVNRGTMLAALRHAVSLGVSYFDTAPGYGGGLAELLFGEALEGAPVFLATKVPLSAAGDVRRSLEASLRRLRRDRIDLLQLHGPLYGSDEEAIVPLLGAAAGGAGAAEGRGRRSALTGFTSEDSNTAVYRFIACGGFDAMQICYKCPAPVSVRSDTAVWQPARGKASRHGDGDDADRDLRRAPALAADGESRRYVRLYARVHPVRAVEPAGGCRAGGDTQFRRVAANVRPWRDAGGWILRRCKGGMWQVDVQEAGIASKPFRHRLLRLSHRLHRKI